MAYHNKFDRNGSAFKLGAAAETGFELAAKKSGYKISKGTRSDDINHIDFFMEMDGGIKMSVDVKSRKKIKRSDESVNDELLWIEFKNVRGMRGWLYGKADLIAFERENDFLLVNRKLFARLCEKLCDLTKMNIDRSMPLYTGYQRKDRLDVLSLIKMADIIENIKYSIIKK